MPKTLMQIVNGLREKAKHLRRYTSLSQAQLIDDWLEEAQDMEALADEIEQAEDDFS